MKKHVLRNLHLDELSGVDVPAQEHATAVITKSMSLIKTTPSAETSATTHNPPQEQTVTDAEKQALEAKIADLTKSNTRLSILSKLTDEERLYLGRMADDEQEVTIAKGFAGARGVLRTAIDADAVVYTALDGQVFRKSHDQTLVTLVKRNDDLTKALAKQTEATLSVEIEKQAVVVMKNFACESNVKIAIMKAVEGIADEKVRAEAAQAILKADGALGLALTRHSDPGALPAQGSPEAQIEILAKNLQKAQPKLTFEQAYSRVISDGAEGSALFAAISGD